MKSYHCVAVFCVCKQQGYARDKCDYWKEYKPAFGDGVDARPEERPTLLQERGSTHGDFTCNGQIMQALKDVMRAHPGWQKLEPYEREALEMIQHKIGRVLCGNHKYFDHWKDIGGYAKLVEERCPK